MMGISTMDADGLFGVPVMAGLDKAARLDYGESLMTHAMVFQGANFDVEGKPTLWRVENSWGKGHGHDGYDLMTDDWFSEYVYQVVVDRKYLTEDELAAYDSAPLAPWDRPARSVNSAAKAIPRRLRSLTSALALSLYHSQLLDALFRLACNRPRDLTIGAVGGLRLKRRDIAITQHIDARFSRPATQSHEMPQFNKICPFDSFESLLFANIQAHGSSQLGINRRRNRSRCPTSFRAVPRVGANVNADRRKNSERLAQLSRFLSALEVRDEHKAAPRQVGNLLLRVALRFAERPYRTPKIGRIVNSHIITSVIIQDFMRQIISNMIIMRNKAALSRT